MNVESRVAINGSAAEIWHVITAIENARETISGIDRVEILERPASGLVGLKWEETRTMFGKAATEIMWITEAVENEFYNTRAESHGCIYTCAMRISETEHGCHLTMTHHTQPKSILAKLLVFPMGLMFKGSLRKVMLQDLIEIKAAVEQANGSTPAKQAKPE